MTLDPFVSDSDFTLYVGDVRDVLAGLPDGSVDCVVTIVCPCGCGESFSPIGSRGRPRRYFSPACSLRVNNYSLLNGGTTRDALKPVQIPLLNPFYGRHHTDETRATLSAKASVPKPYLRGARNGMSGRTGPANPNYKDGSSPERQRLYASGEWQASAKQVYRRDNYRCQKCGASKAGPRSLHVHHIKPWGDYPKLRFEMDNLLTLCRECHHDAHRKEVRHQ